MEFIVGAAAGILLLVMCLFLYVSEHIRQERKAGKQIPLPWEKPDRKPFDKSDIKYRDGDNT